ncbi:HD-GYP domain-containing protein [Giesbergeria anulus]|uniref:HD domain-containing protein n=1 Tax=Giesbergeria anulus TaxID=180197 RepID=A0A1H9LGI6_9BURK|nr:HD domain-containing phosphohydrolase [Giesbergeria anulus]SER10317.1 HD domain-containing protein [Giesbergeria anulus]
MQTFQRKTAGRIAAVTLLMAACASPLAWFVSRENAEEEVVAFAQEESRRVLSAQDSLRLDGPKAAAQAQQAAQLLTGGLFEIAEIYGADGSKLAESVTPAGHTVEPQLPRHGAPQYVDSFYESLPLPSGEWVLRVFVPLREAVSGPVTGYFEGVRIIPEWQRQQIVSDAFIVSLMVCLASLVCGAVIYPVVVHLVKENEHKAQQVLESHIAMMEALGRAIAKRDSDTGAHNYRVAWLAASTAHALGLQGAAMQSLIAGSFLHDAGKIGIPDAILLKPGRLDDAEMATMRTHVALGEDIVTGAGWLDGARDVVGSHHEKWDGSGYPRGLSGQNIPLSARIFAVADVFDALSSRRPYKEPLPFEQVMAILHEGRGSHFDPLVLDTFTQLAPELHRQLQGLDEAATRKLMTDMVQRHFDILV